MTEFFFCLNCRVTAELDQHGRCGTCGSDAVTYPGTYRLWMPQLEAGYMSEKSPATRSVFMSIPKTMIVCGYWMLRAESAPGYWRFTL